MLIIQERKTILFKENFVNIFKYNLIIIFN